MYSRSEFCTISVDHREIIDDRQRSQQGFDELTPVKGDAAVPDQNGYLSVQRVPATSAAKRP